MEEITKKLTKDQETFVKVMKTWEETDRKNSMGGMLSAMIIGLFSKIQINEIDADY